MSIFVTFRSFRSRGIVDTIAEHWECVTMIHLLHISDLHLVSNPNWNNMSEAILAAVKEKLRNVPPQDRLLVITGDFHNFAQGNYALAKIFLDKLIEAMQIDRKTDVFLIPGNHDVEKTASTNLARSDAIFRVKQEPEMLLQRMKTLLQKDYYTGYLDFLIELGIYSDEDIMRLLPIQAHVRSWRNRLNLLHLNTTLVADGAEKGNQMTDTGRATGTEIRDELRQGSRPCLCLGHNSFFDLHEKQRKQLAGLFYLEKVSAYLCGDRHILNRKQEENVILLENEYNPVSIPNVVCYRSSADEGDNYSDFGMIWHLLNETTKKVTLELLRWDPTDPGKMILDKTSSYNLVNPADGTPAPEAQKNNKNHIWQNNEMILAEKDRPLQDGNVRNYLLGNTFGRTYWNLVFSNRLVRREIVDVLLDRLEEGGAYILTGAGGEGKTTALMQLCAELIKKGTPVFYYCGHLIPELPESIPEGAVFLIDNPSDRSAFQSLLENLINLGENCRVVLAARENEWNLLKLRLQIPNNWVISIPIQQVSATEAEAFTRCVCSNLSHTKTRSEIRSIFLNNANGFLYAAMLLSVRQENSLEEIAKHIVDRLSERSEKGLFLLSCIVASEHCGDEFSRRLFQQICNYLNFSHKDAVRALSREISCNGSLYQTRHPIISELFYKDLFVEGALYPEEINEIIKAMICQHLEIFKSSAGRLRLTAWRGIKSFAKCLALLDIDTLEHVIDRILDEIKGQRPNDFNQFADKIGDETAEAVFIRRCSERGQLDAPMLRSWCKRELERGSLWDYDQQYSCAWIYRKVCCNGEMESNGWLDWAYFEFEKQGAGIYDKPDSARWIFREACLNHAAGSNTWMAWGNLVQQCINNKVITRVAIDADL